MSITATRRYARRCVRLSVVLALGGAVLGGAAGAQAAAVRVGYLRLAHFSPDTPPVDVYLTSYRTSKTKVFPGVGYGTVSAYQPVPPGLYTVAMRGAGAAASSPPAITANVQVQAGAGYTVAGMGLKKSLRLPVLHDDLAPPSTGRARVRVINASSLAGTIDARLSNGTDVAANLPFATTSAYELVRAGNWDLVVSNAKGVQARKNVALQQSAVYSVVVLDGQNSKVNLLSVTEAAAMVQPPRGSVETGAGGTAGRRDVPIAVRSLLGALLVGGLAFVVARPRRPGRHRRGTPVA